MKRPDPSFRSFLQIISSDHFFGSFLRILPSDHFLRILPSDPSFGSFLRTLPSDPSFGSFLPDPSFQILPSDPSFGSFLPRYVPRHRPIAPRTRGGAAARRRGAVTRPSSHDAPRQHVEEGVVASFFLLPSSFFDGHGLCTSNAWSSALERRCLCATVTWRRSDTRSRLLIQTKPRSAARAHMAAASYDIVIMVVAS